MRINYGRRSKKGLVTTICATVLLSFPGAPLARANKPWTWQQRVTALAAFVESAPSGSFGVSRARDSIVAIDQQSNEFTLIDRLRWQVRDKKSFEQLPVVRRSVPKVQSNAEAVPALLIYLSKPKLKLAHFRSFNVITLTNSDGYLVCAFFASDEK